jgi:hypothetical protein
MPAGSSKIIASALKALVGCVLMLQLTANVASASPISWTFQNTPGVTGSLIYDADQTGVCSPYPPNTNPSVPTGCTGLLSSWNITAACPSFFSECGTSTASYTFTSANSYVAAVTSNIVSLIMGSTDLGLEISSQARTDAGGTVLVSGVIVEGPNDGIVDNFILFNYQTADLPGGQLSTSTAPEPASATLLGTSLIALFVGRRFTGVLSAVSARRVPAEGTDQTDIRKW